MLRIQWCSIWLLFKMAILIVLSAGCQMIEPEPTPSPAESVATAESAVDEFVNAVPLASTSWTLVFFGPPEARVPTLPNTRATVNYFWDRYAGYDGCNWFLGVYEASNEGEMRMMTPSRTRNVCEPEGLYEQAALYVSSLLNTTEYLSADGQLIHNTVEDQRLLTHDPAKPIPMLGTEWDLAFWWNDEREQWAPVVLQSRTFILFSEGGEATGSGGCNNYSVTYEGDLQIEKVMEATATYAELPALTFGPVASQMAECTEPEGIMDQEQAFFVALGSTAYYFKLGGTVMMLDAEGVPLLLFGARY